MPTEYEQPAEEERNIFPPNIHESGTTHLNYHPRLPAVVAATLSSPLKIEMTKMTMYSKMVTQGSTLASDQQRVPTTSTLPPKYLTSSRLSDVKGPLLGPPHRLGASAVQAVVAIVAVVLGMPLVVLVSTHLNVP
jgi:hypothetical protein